MGPIFDGAWRRRALAGDAEAVQGLVDAALEPLFAFCLYRVGRDRHLCEEVVQETLLRALRELAHYDPARSGNNIFSWLTGLARNEIHRVLRRQRAGKSLETLWANVDRELMVVFARLESEPFADEVLQRQETRDLVNATMAQLPTQYREALEAKYVGNKSVRDMAKMWGATEKSVESMLTRARKAFRATWVVVSGTSG